MLAILLPRRCEPFIRHHGDDLRLAAFRHRAGPFAGVGGGWIIPLDFRKPWLFRCIGVSGRDCAHVPISADQVNGAPIRVLRHSHPRNLR